MKITKKQVYKLMDKKLAEVLDCPECCVGDLLAQFKKFNPIIKKWDTLTQSQQEKLLVDVLK